MIMDKMICPDCGSNDYDELYYDDEMMECNDCGAIFPKRLEECECGSNRFIPLLNGLFVCKDCSTVYDESGGEIPLMCQECGCMVFEYLGQVGIFEECFECVDCKERYDSNYPELYY